MAAVGTMDELARVFAGRMAKLVEAAEVGGRLGLAAGGSLIYEEVRRIISQPYPPASVPGEPPHQRRGEDEGGLLGSYSWWPEGSDTVAIGSIGADPELLPVYLEFGTSIRGPVANFGTSIMKPRPHMRPAVANMVAGGRGGQLGEAFRNEVARAIRMAIR